MEKRIHERISFGMMAKINSKPGMLVNLSRGGLRLSTDSIPTSNTIAIDLIAGNQTLSLSGFIQWINKKISTSNLNEIGVSIKNAPVEYYQFIDELFKHTEYKGNYFYWILILIIVLLFIGIFSI